MKYILILFFVFGCKPCNEELVLQQMKPVMKMALAFADIADSLKKENDSLRNIQHTIHIPQGLWETSNEGYLVKRDTIFLNLDSIPSGTSISGEGVDKSIIKGSSFVTPASIGFMPDSIWITDKQVPWPIAVRDGKQIIPNWDSIRNIKSK